MNEYSEEEEQALAELLGELLDRKNGGEELDAEALKAEHPAFAADIESFLGMRDIFADALGDAVLDRAYGDEEEQLAERFPLAERLHDLPFGTLHRMRAEGGSIPRELVTVDPLFNRTAKRRLARSIRHASVYQSPGFLRILDHGQLESGPYLVRESMTGPNLAEMIDRILESGRMLPDVETEGEGRPVARAEMAARCLDSKTHLARLGSHMKAWARILDAGHRAGLVHRELNAHDLGLLKTGQPVIQGLGLAWQGTGIPATQLPEWIPLWLAPEVIDPKWGPVTHLADVYSFGRALADALSLTLPTPPEDAESELMHIAIGDRAFLEDLPPLVPVALRELIEAATFPDPSRRLASLAEFADRLGKALPQDEEPRGWAARLFGR